MDGSGHFPPREKGPNLPSQLRSQRILCSAQPDHFSARHGDPYPQSSILKSRPPVTKRSRHLDPLHRDGDPISGLMKLRRRSGAYVPGSKYSRERTWARTTAGSVYVGSSGVDVGIYRPWRSRLPEQIARVRKQFAVDFVKRANRAMRQNLLCPANSGCGGRSLSARFPIRKLPGSRLILGS